MKKKKSTDWTESLRIFNENKRLYELVMSKEKRDEINRFKEAGDIKSLLKETNLLIDKLKIECKNLYFDDIVYKTDKNYKKKLTIIYNTALNPLIHALEEIFHSLYNNDKYTEKVFQDGYQDLQLDIELNGKLNQIDIMNGLPNFMKNLGLGKKIYKKLIKDFNYISSFVGIKPSTDSDMTWDSILDDHEIFSFANDDNIISFWNEYDYDKIIKKLKKFYKIPGMMKFDDDFCLKYKLTDEELEKLIK